MRKVVVTGLGIVAPTGNCVVDAWNRALSGSSAVEKISQFDPSGNPVEIAAEVKGFDASSIMNAKEVRQSSRFVQFAASSAKQAMDDSGLPKVNGDADRYGCSIGVGLGAFGAIEEGAHLFKERGEKRLSPFLLPYTIPNMAAGVVSAAHGLQGPSFSTGTACASGTHAIGEAFLHVAMGNADVMIAGGAESAITPLAVACFARMGALSTRNDDPNTASRPFDADRDGFVMGEGCGILVLEEFQHARQRSAEIYAELVGYGMSADAYHITKPAPRGEGLVACMKAALRAARIAPEDIDYINAHGTSTQINDASESAAIEALFNGRAKRLAVSSTKGVTGHCLGGAGGIEALYTVLTVYNGIIPPTANYTTPDPECRLDYTPNEAREMPVRFALSNSCGFGGQNACLVFKQFK